MCLFSPLQISKYYASMLHFKLKYKKVYGSIYNVKHQQAFWGVFFPSNAIKLRLGS